MAAAKLDALWVCVLLIVVQERRAACQEGDFLSDLSVVEFYDVSNDTLVLDEPIRLSLGGWERVMFGIDVLVKEGVTPDVVINLMVINPGGDSDVYCNMLSSVREVGSPTPMNSLWGSNHTQGDDTVFISRTHPAFDEEEDFIVRVDGEPFRAKRIVCALYGAESEASETYVEIGVMYEYRELVQEEVDALLGICKSCCLDSGPCPCVGYNRDVNEPRQFLGGTEFCHEPGNVCTDEGRLLRLSLDRFNLTCEFPSTQILQLESVKTLDLSNNQFTGDINSVAGELSMMKDLQWLNLRNNQLSDRLLPDGGICNLASSGLIFLNLAGNDILGSIPSCLFDENATFHELHLDKNQFTGKLPEFSTEVLEILSLSRNSLTGTLPMGLGKIDNMRGIRLSKNKLSGALPSNIGEAGKMRVLHLDNNVFSGRIPDSFARSLTIREIWLFNNSLTSLPIDWEAGPLVTQTLGFLELSNNDISAGFPMGLARSSGIEALSIAENNFFGPLPQTKGLFPSGSVLLFSHNDFNGSIPENFQTMGWFANKTLHSYRYSILDLSFNQLTGEVPEFLYDSERPASIGDKLVLEGNTFTCSKPERYSDLSGLSCSSDVTIEGIGDTKKKSLISSLATFAILAIIVGVLIVLVVAVVVIGTLRRRKAKRFEGIVGEMSLEPSAIRNSRQVAVQARV